MYGIDYQFSLFEEEPVKAKGITQDEIDRCLGDGSGFDRGKLRIYRQYEKHLGAKKNEDFLRREYGVGERWPAYMCKNEDDEVSIDYNGKGITIQRIKNHEGEKVFLSWAKVEKRIGELIDAGSYMTESDLEYPCCSCIFEKDGWCKHIDKFEIGEQWYCKNGSFRIPKGKTCSKCGREIKLQDIQQEEMGGDFYRCPCGQITSFANQGNRPGPMDLWQKGELIGE